MGLFTRKKTTEQIVVPPPPNIPASSQNISQELNNDFSPWDEKLTVSKNALSGVNFDVPKKTTSTDFSKKWQIPIPVDITTKSEAMPNTVFSSLPSDLRDETWMQPPKPCENQRNKNQLNQLNNSKNNYSNSN